MFHLEVSILVKNALTIDVEDWFHATYLGVPEKDWPSCDPWIKSNIHRILDILAKEDVKATFFILGWIAERTPELIQTIADEGHEIASHSYYHRQVFRQSPAEFAQDLRLSIESIQSAVDVPILGYRAPAASIGKDQKWAFEIMVENGILYDSSILPVRTPLYGVTGLPRFAFQLCEGRILEIPLSTVDVFNIRFPISGGVYTRLLPISFTEWAFNRVNVVDGQPIMLYLHPWELDPQPPPLGRNSISRWSHIVNKGKMEGRFRQLLSRFSFGPVRDVFSVELDRIKGIRDGKNLEAGIISR
jgi:polysaccharide deacetylase family protein (PEP-CTERM system associated)